MEMQHWKGEDIQIRFADCASWMDLVQKIESELTRKGAVICRFIINGKDFSDDELSTHAGKALTEIEDLKIEYSHPDDLASHALNQMVEVIPKLNEAALHAAELFRAQQNEKAQHLVAGLFENCHFMHDTILALQSSHSHWLRESDVVEKLASTQAGFEVIVKELLAAYEKRDYFLVADVLEYEVPNALESWRQLIVRVSENSVALSDGKNK